MNNKNRDWLVVATRSADNVVALFEYLKGSPLSDAEIRKAITGILLSDHDYTGENGRKLIAALFNPQLMPKAWKQQRTVVFKKTGKGHSNEAYDFSVATAVQVQRERGKPYQKAIEDTAECLKVSERHIARIFAKYKDFFAKYKDS
jgi:AraC-like DNA-binding protein